MTGGPITDALLMREVAWGNRGPLEKLIRRHADGLLTFIERTVGDRHRSEDIFQEVFMAVWSKRHQYRYPCPFKPWLYKIALNRCREHFRGARTQMSPLPDDEPAVSSEPAPDQAAIAVETALTVTAAVARLPESQRAVVVLRMWSGMSYSEIAEVIGRSEGTIRSNMYQALKRLRSHLETRLK